MASSDRTHITRRVAITAALASAAVPAVPALAIGSGEDAELLRIGAELDAFYPEWLRDREREYAANDAAEEEIERRLGFQPSAHMGPQQSKEWQRVMFAVWAEQGRDAVIKSCQASWNRLDCLQNRVLELEAHTPAGVAVKARTLARFCMGDLWELAEPNDWQDHQIRNLIEAVCSLAGTSPGVTNA